MPSGFPIHLVEEHSSVLPIWWQRHGGPATVVYLDAHLDLQQTAPETLRALAQCRTPEQVGALESPHHLNPSPRYAYGIENFLHPASKLGLIDRLVWVAPPHIPRSYSPSLLSYVEQMDGVSFEELTGFRSIGRDGMRGRLLGLDISICHFDDLANLDIRGPYALDIDVDYFVVVPGDRPWVDPRSVIQAVIEQIGTPDLATVSRAVGSGFTPLQFRYLGDYAVAVLSEDDAATEHYGLLHRAVSLLAAGRAGEAGSLCRQAIAARPSCAASRYMLSLASRDSRASRSLRVQAAELDPKYAFDLSREASGVLHRRRRIGVAELRAMVARLDSLASGSLERALAELAVGQLCAELGMVEQALRLLDKQRGEFADHGDLALLAARRVLQGRDPNRAFPLLERARQFKKTRTSATLYLGDLALRAGNLRGALKHYEEVEQLAPAWSLPLERLRKCHDALGNSNRASAISALVAERKRVIAGLPGMG